MVRIVTALVATLTLILTAPATHASNHARVVATIPVGSQPWGVAVSPDGSTAYVTNRAGNSVSVIDLSSRSVTHTISSISSPLGLAFTPDGSQAYVTAASSFARIDTATHTVAQTISSGLCTTPNNIVANPDGSAMYASCTADRGASISTSTQAVNAGLVNTMDPIRDVALAPDANSLIWARNANVWFQGTGYFTTPPSTPFAVTTAPGVNRAFTANSTSGTVSVIDTTGFTSLLGSIAVGGTPRDIAVTSDGTTGYVTDETGNRIVIVDLVGLQVTGEVAVGSTPIQVALTPDETQVLVANSGSNTVSVIDLASPASGDDVPRAALQQFARAESDTCDAQPADLIDFPALSDHVGLAWGASWSQWPNGGTGGFVCTRQPFYTSRGTWSVQ